jgi:hypothetical protein
MGLWTISAKKDDTHVNPAKKSSSSTANGSTVSFVLTAYSWVDSTKENSTDTDCVMIVFFSTNS